MRSSRLLTYAAATAVVAATAAGAAAGGPPHGATARQADTARPASSTPLVADAGDSAFVRPGDAVTFLGAGYGGQAPYTFSWTVDGRSPVGLRGDDAATAELVTSPKASGVHTARLTVTDRAGKQASDTVRFVIGGSSAQTLLKTDYTDAMPGVAGADGGQPFPFKVPAGLSDISVHVTWDNPANDYDLRVLDPKGSQRGASGNGAPDNFEDATVTHPEPGTWQAVVDRFASVADTLHVTVTGHQALQDTLPKVETARHTYRFEIGRPQQLSATVTGGDKPSVRWDLDADGRYETGGTKTRSHLGPGLHLVTAKAVDRRGFERRQTAAVYVGTAEQLQHWRTPITVIGISDTGINPYHLEYSAATYPDPEVLALTRNFTRPPSEYIPGYPADAKPLPVTLGKGYYPKQDTYLWNGNAVIKPGQLYWIPGTKIIGALDAGGSTGATSSDDPHPILDDNEHGSGTSSVSTGNRYGYCPSCLIVMVEGLDATVNANFPWVDISSNSFGPVAGAPTGLVGSDAAVKAAAERGQLELFAAGNGVGNAFDVPVSTTVQDETGPDWTIDVGAIRRDNQGAIVGDGNPVDISAWGDGNLPSACGVGTVGQCAFGGTSAATPYTAGVFGSVLTQVREILGDDHTGQRKGQVIAQGTPVPSSPYLKDGRLTRHELVAAVLKTAVPLVTDGAPSQYPYPATYTGAEGRYLFEGYGAATPNGASRALAVLLGKAQMPARPDEDSFFAQDCEQRDGIYGRWDRDGDGKPDDCSKDVAVDPAYQGKGTVTTDPAVAHPYDPARAAVGEVAAATKATTFYLHRQFVGTPEHAAGEAPGDDTGVPLGTPEKCGPPSLFDEFSMDGDNRKGDVEPCYDGRVTSTAAAFRPLGIFASTAPLTAALPAGSTVDVDLYMAADSPAVEVRGALEATDRILGAGGTGAPQPFVPSDPHGELCSNSDQCWNHVTFSFTTDRPAVPGEQLTFEISSTGAQAWAYGYEGEHASKITVTPKGATKGLDFGATVDSVSLHGDTATVGGDVAFPDLGSDPKHAGFHPTFDNVEVSVDDPLFTDPVFADVDPVTGRWSAVVETGHTLYVRAIRDRAWSAVTHSSFTPRKPKQRAAVVISTDQAVAGGSLPLVSLPAGLDARPAASSGHAGGWPVGLAVLLLAGLAAAHRTVPRRRSVRT